MSDYKIIKEESEVREDDLITMIRVFIGENRYINLKFGSELVKDSFYNKSSADIQHREKIKERVIEILLREKIQKENLLNILIKKALECPDVKKQIDNRKIGQYLVTSEDFLNYNFRVCNIVCVCAKIRCISLIGESPVMEGVASSTM